MSKCIPLQSIKLHLSPLVKTLKCSIIVFYLEMELIMKRMLILSMVSVTCFASLKGPHDSASYNRVIKNAQHEINRVNAIGFDDSTGVFSNGSETGSNTPPGAPVVDLIESEPTPQQPEPEPEPTEVTLNCGCAKVWRQSDGLGPTSCFNPKRAKAGMDAVKSGFWARSYGTFWPNVDSIEFVGTYNIEGSTPVLTNIEARHSGGRLNVTDHIKNLGVFAFTKPNMDVANKSCSVTLINPARTYTRSKVKSHYNDTFGQTYSSNNYYYHIIPGVNSVNKNNYESTTAGRYHYSHKWINGVSENYTVPPKYYY